LLNELDSVADHAVEPTPAWFVYMIKTEKGALYTGIATDPDRRFLEHLAAFEGKPLAKAKKGAKYFRSQKPVKIVYREAFESRSLATKRELAIKKLPSSAKGKLVLDDT